MRAWASLFRYCTARRENRLVAEINTRDKHHAKLCKKPKFTTTPTHACFAARLAMREYRRNTQVGVCGQVIWKQFMVVCLLPANVVSMQQLLLIQSLFYFPCPAPSFSCSELFFNNISFLLYQQKPFGNCRIIAMTYRKL
ncbi:unnamed protein product [Ceratitis capitata]|uniref:(Mediterranean fruit fly) hypothetical protein n=1 Tax=Ceratitis capitata TaxID=7213 RepID=A0A811VF31_CERCA|nr:unnamed protein product [Ceratitis capitata]